MFAAKSKLRLLATLISAGLATSLLQATPALAAAPSVSISVPSAQRSLSLNETATITFTTSEVTSDFTLSDLSVVSGSGTFSNFTAQGDGVTYTATFTPTTWAYGTIWIQVLAGAFTNGGGESNTASLQTPIYTDNVAPVIAYFYAWGAAGTRTAGQTVKITVEFMDNMDADAYMDVTLNTGAVVRLDVLTTATEAEGTYTIGTNDTTNGAFLNVTSYALNSTLQDQYGNLMVSNANPAPADNIAGSLEIVIGSATPTTYAVTYNTNGAETGTAPTTSSFAANSTVSVSGNSGQLRKPGYVFAGWNTAADGTGTSYNGDDTFNIGTSAITLYAQWRELVKKNKLKSIPFVAFENKLNSKGKAALNAYAFAIKNKPGKRIQITGYAVGPNTAATRAFAVGRARAAASQLKAAGVTGTFVIKGVASATKRSTYVATSWTE